VAFLLGALIYLAVVALTIPSASYVLARMGDWDEEDAPLIIRWSFLWPVLWTIILYVLIVWAVEPVVKWVGRTTTAASAGAAKKGAKKNKE
jgi:hypothetical protein